MATLIAALVVSAASAPASAQLSDIAPDASAADAEARAVKKPAADMGARVFGDWLFTGQFANQEFSGFNPEYQLAIGDIVSLRVWGGFDFEGQVTVDNQGNVFIPKVGPVPVVGVRNGDLNEHVTKAVMTVFKSNVGIYASLAGAEPVKVFVTGFVRRPGLYAGHSADSVLRFLDLAGGIDSRSGSYIDLIVLRNGKVLADFNLYDFLLRGMLPGFQLFDGDTILVRGLRGQVKVEGLVQNPYFFEFVGDEMQVADILALAKPNPEATHLRISHNSRAKREVDYYSLAEAADVAAGKGDLIEVVSDKTPGTIAVRVEGEHDSPREFILPYGARLGDVLSQIRYTSNADPASIQLFRKSVRLRQKEMLLAQLRALESSVLTARSNTRDEAALRAEEAKLILQWVDRAKTIDPKGQVSLAGSNIRDDILLEPGDIIRVPRISNLVMVHGDVLFPSAMAYATDRTPLDYIELAGGFTQNRRSATVLVLHQDGTFDKLKGSALKGRNARLRPGDEIFVMPKVHTKYVQLTKDIVTVLYQIAISAGVLLRL